MRCGTTIAVTVLATGVICGGAPLAAGPPPADQSTLEGTVAKPAQRAKTSVEDVPWKQATIMPEHALLKGLVGHWTTNVHVFEGQLAKARDSEGTADGKLLMGGLFVQVTQSETRMRQPYEGMTLYGFNEGLGKYTADAIDSARTETVHSVGTYDPAKKQLTMSSHYSQGKLKRLTIARSVTTFIDDKMWTYEEFVSYAVGEKEFPVVAITFKKD